VLGLAVDNWGGVVTCVGSLGLVVIVQSLRGCARGGCGVVVGGVAWGSVEVGLD